MLVPLLPVVPQPVNRKEIKESFGTVTDWSLRLKNTPQPSVSYVKSGNDKAKRQHAVGTLTCDHNLWGKTCGLQDLQKKRMPSVPCYSTEWHQPFMAPLAPLWERESIFCSDAHSLSPLLHFELKSVCRVECQSLKLKKTKKKTPTHLYMYPSCTVSYQLTHMVYHYIHFFLWKYL